MAGWQTICVLCQDVYKRQLENRANSIHDYTEEILDVRMFEELEGQEDEESPIYIQNKDLMERVRRASGIRYLYTAKKTEDGRFVYLVDALHSRCV